MNKLFETIKDLSWTLGGTALVLITLSGRTREIGLWISGISLAAYLLVTFLVDEE